MSPSADSTTRFSNRVADYVRYRPGYPAELVLTLQAEAGLNAASVVADIGSGTGISTDLFLSLGCDVYAVEPNAAMRAAAEARFSGQARFHSVDATAEQTSLPEQSVDLIAAGQAFHWFDVDRARQEFLRVLRPDGFVALFWNSRRTDSTPFLKDYETLLIKFATDYQQVNHTNVDRPQFIRLFGGTSFESRTFPSHQDFDWDGLRGRLMSSSYAPAADDLRHGPMMLELERLFRQHESGGLVRFEYDTELHFGRLHS